MTTKEQLDDRYGRTSRRTVRIWISVVAAVAALVAVLYFWSYFSETGKNVDVDDLGFTVVSDSETEVSFRITSAHDEPAVCVLEALDEDFGKVGWQVVELPPTGSVTNDYVRSVRTLDTATTGYVNSCVLR
ncbi:MAG: DUF4307 domain-containing protein [Microbacterium gubbeenense]|uniref:DUF4307 domain-containing protein n=1 Tax=Microbacterium gubbeenense TaxID=159896 RepID=UPI003F9B4FC7